MTKKRWFPYLIGIVSAEAVGGLSALLSRNAMSAFGQSVQQPPLSPPRILFPIVWSILYALMGFSATRIWLSPPSAQRSKGLNLYVAQLIVNFFWSLIFFNAQAYGFAFFWLIALWLLVFWMIVVFQKVNPPAAWLQIPYLLWLSFAAYLNAGVWWFNA